MMFREHRGSLTESLKTKRPISDISELGDVEVKEYGYDYRLKSDTKIVVKDGVVIGFITKEDDRCL